MIPSLIIENKSLSVNIHGEKIASTFIACGEDKDKINIKNYNYLISIQTPKSSQIKYLQ